MNRLSKPYRKLWRSRRERKIAGICGGLGIYFNMDPFWIRFLFVIFSFRWFSAVSLSHYVDFDSPGTD
ncbi:PspC domain-containing protein [Legionella tunisiensis]|uniref:PspC domain-containing protein n=1 Tax=Legionella tunisiensis TaxID=1034944 RepID=UPI001E2AC0A4|nr:PspC domain-containing protein [Legionella tunisiensis]